MHVEGIIAGSRGGEGPSILSQLPTILTDLDALFILGSIALLGSLVDALSDGGEAEHGEHIEEEVGGGALDASVFEVGRNYLLFIG